MGCPRQARSRWSASGADLFQSPFRAGIKILDHQLTPLKKALALPRANLFIADDVGLGKTIEAGLVMSELELRQRVLVVCPASICLQWQGEMERRFGQRFEIMNRDFMARRRRERGFGVPAWSTHNRFIVSYQTLRRPEYREPLLVHLGTRLKKSLLVLDEAHTAAPASAGVTALDSDLTSMVRDDLGPRFDNRLFLSAIEAFHRTLSTHAAKASETDGKQLALGTALATLGAAPVAADDARDAAGVVQWRSARAPRPHPHCDRRRA